MPPARTLTISRPFDARHVSGVNIPGVTMLKAVPMPDRDKTFPPTCSSSSTSAPNPNEKEKQRQKQTQAPLEPDEIPTHLNIGAARQVPKRSHSIAEGLGLGSGWRRPTLRVRGSLSMGGLRGRGRVGARSGSGSGPGAGAGDKGEREEKESERGDVMERTRTSRGSAVVPSGRVPESTGLAMVKATLNERERGKENVQRSSSASMESKRLPRIPTNSDKNLPKKPTERGLESKGLARGMEEKEKENVQQRRSTGTSMERKRLPRTPMNDDKDLAKKLTEQKSAPTTSSRASERPPQLPDVKDLLANRPPSHAVPPTLQPNRRTANTASVPKTRPKRADSGTAIDFSDVTAQERPLGFKEILAVESLAERMELYRRTREYWANADHGLVDWMEVVAGKRS